MKYCVAAADAGRCRIFVLDAHDVRRGRSMTLQPLREVEGLINPERRLTDAQVFSDSRPGLRRSGGRKGGNHGGGAAARHGVDDRRGQHRLDEDRRFASDVSDHIAEVCREFGPCGLVLAAPPRMLGLLREKIATRWHQQAREGVQLTAVSKDVTALSLPEMHDYFAGAELLPPRGRRRLRAS